jgi:peptidyl-prolyl cis-trans isomerase SurA
MAQPGVVVDRIAAQIGDNIILLSDIEAQKQQAVAAGMEITPNMTCEVLEELMYQQLLINQAKLDSLVVSDEQVDAEMENRIRVIENQIGSRQKMEEFYGKSVNDIKNEFRTIIRERLMANEMERKITADISVTPKEAQEFYATIPEDSIPLINAQLSFQQIVNYPEITKEDKKLAYEKLQGILDEIRKGKSFETQARIH